MRMANGAGGSTLESRMHCKVHVRFGGGRMETYRPGNSSSSYPAGGDEAETICPPLRLEGLGPLEQDAFIRGRRQEPDKAPQIVAGVKHPRRWVVIGLDRAGRR
jgi:hypothetical protein